MEFSFSGFCTGNQAYTRCCTSNYKCGENEGDCIDDEDCRDDLRCGSLNCLSGYMSTMDCCYNHTAGKLC